MGNGATGRRDLFYMEPLIVGATGETPTMLSAWRKTEETCGLKKCSSYSRNSCFLFQRKNDFCSVFNIDDDNDFSTASFNCVDLEV